MQSSSASPGSSGVLVQHRVAGFSEDWIVGEPVPEAAWHDHTVELLRALLEHWIASTGRDAAVFRNLAVRVREDRPNVGFDPDVALVVPAPPGARELSSLRLWEAGHGVPRLVIEVVSPGHPQKDYAEIPDQCAALGVGELVVFDPKLAGPRALGGPRLLQVWRRTEEGVFARVAEGDGPFESDVLGAYLVVTEGGSRLRVSDDTAGARLWPTPAEAERAGREAERIAKDAERAGREAERVAKDAERVAKDAERAMKERALQRIAELEAELARRGS